MILRDPWAKRHPRLCRIFLIPVSFAILLLLLVTPALDKNFETLFMQINISATMLFIRMIPLNPNTLLNTFNAISLMLIFLLPQIFYSYYYQRRPLESQSLFIFFVLFMMGIFYHGYKAKENYYAVLRFQPNPVSEKDLYESVGKPLYWRRSTFNNKMLGFYTNGYSVTYIERNEKGHFIVNAPYIWLN